MLRSGSMSCFQEIGCINGHSLLQDLARSSYECDEEDANEVDECIGAFSRYVS